MSAGNTARLYRVEALIRARGQVSFKELLADLEVSPATLKRDLEFLRSRMGAPIHYDASLRAYRFAGRSATSGPQGGLDSKGTTFRDVPRHELPGLWFDQTELHSLLTVQQLLLGLDEGGLLGRHLQPLLDRVQHLLAQGEGADAARLITERVKIVGALRRPVPSQFFERVSTALLTRKRLHMRYLTRGRGEVSEREVSPQRLVHYRSTWYLDAWCHRSNALRRFALDAIEAAQLLPAKARELSMAKVRSQMDAGYGIYAGGRQQWARLLFNPQAAQWASREQWHPEQQGQWREDGSYELRLPYVDDNELVMDLLRQGPQVQVLEPASLVDAVRQRLRAAVALYAEK